MAGLNESNVERKFQTASTTQDSIQSLGLWVIHHKAHHEKIVDIWFKVLKKSKLPHRLTLFYLCNDIVQTCKRKHAIVYKDAFKDVLKDAVLLVRDSSIRNNVERIFKIWEERNVYDTDFIEELGGLLANVKSQATLNTRLLAEFQPGKVMEQISLFGELERTMKLRAKYVSGLKLDTTSADAVRQLKDRAHGKEFSQQFEDTCVKVEDYVVQLERAIKERNSLIEMLEQSELFYDAQYGEAKIVANAYRNFGSRVSNLKKKLEDHKDTLPSPDNSPNLDAPSPEGTPPGIKDLDDIEAVDMELSDEEGKTSVAARVVRCWDVTRTTMSYNLPISSVPPVAQLHAMEAASMLKDTPSPGGSVASAPSPEGSPITGLSPLRNQKPLGSIIDLSSESDSNPPNPLLAAREKWRALKQKKAEADAKLAALSGVAAQPIPTVSSSRIDFSPLGEDLEDEDGTPLKDEMDNRAGTPVQDEMEVSSDPPASTEENSESSVSNPIEFLTQLINQTQQTKQGSTDFLQSLSALTRNVTHQYPEEQQQSTATAGSWGGWKELGQQGAQQAPEYPPPALPPQPVHAPQIVPPPSPMGVPPMSAPPHPVGLPPQPVQPPHSMPSGLGASMGVAMSQMSPVTPPPGMPLGLLTGGQAPSLNSSLPPHSQQQIPGLGSSLPQHNQQQIPGLGGTVPSHSQQQILGNTPPTPPSQGPQIPGLGDMLRNQTGHQIPGLNNHSHPNHQSGQQIPGPGGSLPHERHGPQISGLGNSMSQSGPHMPSHPPPHSQQPQGNNMQQPNMSLPPPQGMRLQTPPSLGMPPHAPQQPNLNIRPPHAPSAMPTPPPQPAQGYQPRFPGMQHRPPPPMPQPNRYQAYDNGPTLQNNSNSWPRSDGSRAPHTPTQSYPQTSPPLGSGSNQHPLSRPNLTQIKTTIDFENDKDSSSHNPHAPHTPTAFRPMRPPGPPGGPRMHSPRGFPMRESSQELQDEFREKLRRKTSVTSPTTPGVSSNFRNLTLVPTKDDMPPAPNTSNANSTSPARDSQKPPTNAAHAPTTPLSSKKPEAPAASQPTPKLRPHRAASDWETPKKPEPAPVKEASEPVTPEPQTPEPRTPDNHQSLGQRAQRIPRMEDRNPSPSPEKRPWPSDMDEPQHFMPSHRPHPHGHPLDRERFPPPVPHPRDEHPRHRRHSREDFRDPYGPPIPKRPPPARHHHGYPPRY